MPGARCRRLPGKSPHRFQRKDASRAMPKAVRTFRPLPGRTRFSCKAMQWPRVACGSWMAWAGPQPEPGSNAWAVAGSRTASGRPILANDPHLEFSIPSPWYLVHLRAPGLNVTGATIIGLPAVIVGHNDHIAWGTTNLQFDVQ